MSQKTKGSIFLLVYEGKNQKNISEVWVIGIKPVWNLVSKKISWLAFNEIINVKMNIIYATNIFFGFKI